jgi:hypothetical protein
MTLKATGVEVLTEPVTVVSLCRWTSTGCWNDVTVTKIPKIGFSEKLIKHTIRELPTLVSEAKKSYIESNEPKFARRPRAFVTSVTFLFLYCCTVHLDINVLYSPTDALIY